ncbi:metal-sensing transcriptional repressor [Desulfitobacterium sp. Sab5]|uniref:metal-sensing transcriptional repressor n=1 Tax=Desulfitobacterium nosdiversum TaxID=3375356 RepID=UPI003CE92530
MSKAIGHMESIKRMIEDGRDYSEILVQLFAVRSAINNVGKVVLLDHINHCVLDAVETGDEKVLEDLTSAIEKFLK